MDRAEALSGFTEGASIVLPYGGQFASDSTIDSYLDEAQRLGIKVIVDFHTQPGVWSSWPSAEELAQKADRHKDHPAVHGWYIADEPNYNSSNETPQYMENIYNQIKSKDPDHPIFIVHNGRTYDSWVNAMDVLMLDHYPGWTLYDPDEFNWMVRKSYSVWLDGVTWVEQHGKEAFIAVPMGFGANEDGSPRNGARDLTYAEYRYHVFSAVVLDTQAIIFYKDSWANSRIKPIVNQIIGQVQAIGAEMNNGVTNDPQISVSESQDRLAYRYGVNGNRHVLLAVNIANHDVSDSGAQLNNVQVTLPAGVRPTQVEVLDERRTLPVSNGTFADDFSGFEVHVYAFEG